MTFGVSFHARKKCSENRRNAQTLVFQIAVLACLVAMLGTTPLLAQSPSFSDFSSLSGLTVNPSAPPNPMQVNGNVLRINSAAIGQVGSVWFNRLQPVAGGFSTTFKFRITPPDPSTELPFPADGLAFVIQNSSNGTAALGQAGGAIGYGGAIPVVPTAPGIDNSLAIEFDTFANDPWDLIDGIAPANHVAIQSCGTNPNTVDHAATYLSGDTTVPCNLAIATAPVNLSTGTHTVQIEYTPATGCDTTCTTPATIQVTIDTLSVFDGPVAVPDLTGLLQLAEAGGELSPFDSAYVGFTGATGSLVENNDLLSWTFTPHGGETITQPAPAGVFTTFNFGSYLYKVRPDKSIDELTVTEVPTDPGSFDPGPNFPGAQCIVYDSTGGKCVEFHAICNSLSNGACSNVNYEVVTSYDVPPGTTITKPGFLKATNQDCPPAVPFDSNIITDFFQTRIDPTTKGSSKPTFSCFVAVQNVTYAPADLDIVNLAPLKVKPGSTLTYVATVTDFGPSSAQGVSISNTIPSGTSYKSVSLCTLSNGCSATPCTFDGTAATCSVGNLAKFGLEFMVVTVKVTALSGKIVDTATVHALNPDPDVKPDRSWTAVTVVSNR